MKNYVETLVDLTCVRGCRGGQHPPTAEQLGHRPFFATEPTGMKWSSADNPSALFKC
jgi:hypothetical protein